MNDLETTTYEVPSTRPGVLALRAVFSMDANGKTHCVISDVPMPVAR